VDQRPIPYVRNCTTVTVTVRYRRTVHTGSIMRACNSTVRSTYKHTGCPLCQFFRVHESYGTGSTVHKTGQKSTTAQLAPCTYGTYYDVLVSDFRFSRLTCRRMYVRAHVRTYERKEYRTTGTTLRNARPREATPKSSDVPYST